MFKCRTNAYAKHGTGTNVDFRAQLAAYAMRSLHCALTLTCSVHSLWRAGGVGPSLVQEHQRPVHEDVRDVDPAEQLRGGGDGAALAAL